MTKTKNPDNRLLLEANLDKLSDLIDVFYDQLQKSLQERKKLEKALLKLQNDYDNLTLLYQKEKNSRKTIEQEVEKIIETIAETTTLKV